MLGFSVSDLLHVLLEISPLTNHFAAIAGSGTKAKAACAMAVVADDLGHRLGVAIRVVT